MQYQSHPSSRSCTVTCRWREMSRARTGAAAHAWGCGAANAIGQAGCHAAAACSCWHHHGRGRGHGGDRGCESGCADANSYACCCCCGGCCRANDCVDAIHCCASCCDGHGWASGCVNASNCCCHVRGCGCGRCCGRDCEQGCSFQSSSVDKSLSLASAPTSFHARGGGHSSFLCSPPTLVFLLNANEL